MSSFKVLITTSGIGSRLGEITKYTNKALVRIGDKPSISHIIESYPCDVNFVITLGYFGDQVKDLLEIAYPNRFFEFVYVDNYEGEGSSLLYSMVSAKDRLQEPFVYHACDTIVEKHLRPPIMNWIGGFKSKGSSTYASINTLGDSVIELHSKGFINCDFLHIGLVGIHDFKTFWEIADHLISVYPNDTSLGDVDVLKLLVKKDIFTLHEITKWHDIGNVDSLEIARSEFKDNNFHVLDKLAESIFKIEGNVIKFFYDSKILNDRVERVKFLNNTVPDLLSVKTNFYKYKYIEGDLFAKVANRDNFIELIKWAESNLWSKVAIETKMFHQCCYNFYIDKTKDRINKFFEKKFISDSESIVNGEVIPRIDVLLSKVDKVKLSQGTPTNFHGDFILDNIIKVGKNDFKLIDWRQDFSGNIEAGDVYYDLAKLAHNLVVNHEIIDDNYFDFHMSSNGSISINIHRLQTLVDCENLYFNYLELNGYDVDKIKLLRALIWINMSPLHHHPFDNFLFYFGKYELHSIINRYENL